MIKLTNFSLELGGNRLIENISLCVSRGDYFCLIGESGGGKTIVGKSILGILPKEFKKSGSLICQRNKMEVILQDPIGSMQSNLTVDSQFQQLLKSKGIKNKEERQGLMAQVLSWVGFSDTKIIAATRPYQLSGGMCQKVAIAMALVSQPEIIIADEPTSALDQENQEIILRLLWKIYQEKKITLFFITHDLAIARKYSTHLGVIQNGQLIESGRTEYLLKSPKQRYTKELLEIFGQQT